ncbi:alginate O-acetyltransferase AlgX-related protein [Methylobacterium oxalidis]|uniref:alginate O-acetyltransferase AlgX-related protein n=1 Tax=Methylobacterium oxalidis TaxID=944322 RepID=UPI0033162001
MLRDRRETAAPDAATGASSVHVGRDGWLFLTGGSNRVLAQYGRGLRRWWLLRAWARLIEARTARAARLGIRCVHTFVPEKLSVYDNLTGGLAYDPGRASTRILARRLMDLPGYVDLLTPFRAARDGPAPLYQRTDTHWTVDGCLLAYRELMRALHAVPPAGIGERPRFEIDGVRDLGAKLPGRPSEVVQHWVLQRDAVRSYANALVETHEAAGRGDELHTGAHVIYRNAAPGIDPRRVILFGDSYAHFAPILLTGLFAESFAEVHFVWSSALDWTYIEAVRPDIVVAELAERFLTRLPKDDYDVETGRRRGLKARAASPAVARAA